MFITHSLKFSTVHQKGPRSIDPQQLFRLRRSISISITRFDRTSSNHIMWWIWIIYLFGHLLSAAYKLTSSSTTWCCPQPHDVVSIAKCLDPPHDVV